MRTYQLRQPKTLSQKLWFDRFTKWLARRYFRQQSRAANEAVKVRYHNNRALRCHIELTRAEHAELSRQHRRDRSYAVFITTTGCCQQLQAISIISTHRAHSFNSRANCKGRVGCSNSTFAASRQSTPISLRRCQSRMTSSSLFHNNHNAYNTCWRRHAF